MLTRQFIAYAYLQVAGISLVSIFRAQAEFQLLSALLLNVPDALVKAVRAPVQVMRALVRDEGVAGLADAKTAACDAITIPACDGAVVGSIFQITVRVVIAQDNIDGSI